MKRWVLPVLGFLIGTALFVGMIYTVGPARCLATLREVGIFGVLSFTGLLLLQILFFTLGWQTLLHGAGLSPPLHWIGISQLMGYVGNNITPSMYLGGEPVAAYFLARRRNLPTRRVMGTMITSKFMQLFAFLMIFFTGSYLIFSRPRFIGNLPPDLHWIGTMMRWANVVAALGCILLVALVVSGKNVLTALLRFVARCGLGPYTLFRWKPKVRGMESTIHHAFQNSRRQTLLCFLYSIGAMLTIYVRPIVFFQFTSPSPSAFSTEALTGALVEAAAFFTLSQVVQAFQFTPGGLGIFDAASVVIFLHVFGISEQYGMAFNIVYRLGDLVVIALGTILIVHYGTLMLLREKKAI